MYCNTTKNTSILNFTDELHQGRPTRNYKFEVKEEIGWLSSHILRICSNLTFLIESGPCF